MRVLLVTDWNRGRGGAEAYIAWLREGLESAGDEVRLMTSSVGTAGDGKAKYVAPGSERMAAQIFLQIANPFAVRTIRRAINEFRPDVILVNMFAHHLSPAILHVIGSIPLVLLISDYKCVCPIGSKLLPDGAICTSQPGWVCCASGCVTLPHWIRDKPRYALIRSAVAKAECVIACSDWVRSELGRSGIDSERIYLPVPTPSADYSRSPSANPVFLYCGRLDVEKGVEQLLRAFALISQQSGDARLRIAGQGAERSRLESLARDLGIESKVTFLGWQDPRQIERELSSAWALVAPSLWAEPLGLVALEAIVHGVPVIASSVGGFAETVEEGVSGLLIPNGDVEALAESLVSIASRRQFANGISPDAVQRVTARHDITDHVERIRATLRNVVSSHQQAAS
jgi:glycosyltransferase involved in cell wall biosynthesis